MDSHKRLKQTFIAALLLGLTLFILVEGFSRFGPEAPPVTLLPLPDGWPSPTRSLSDRVKASLPLWFWRLRDAIRGPLEPVTLACAIFEIQDWPEPDSLDAGLGEPSFIGTNGIQVWILPESKLKSAREYWDQLPGNRKISSPRVSTAHGVQAMMSVGESVPVDGNSVQVGIRMGFLPRLRKGLTDLTTVIALTTAVSNAPAATPGAPLSGPVWIRTNFAAAARIQIPSGDGAFLLSPASETSPGNRIGVAISATRPSQKK